MDSCFGSNRNPRRLSALALGLAAAFSTLVAGFPANSQPVHEQNRPAQRAAPIEDADLTPTEESVTEVPAEPSVVTPTASPSTAPVEATKFDPAVEFVIEEQGFDRSQAEAYVNREREFSNLASQFTDVPGYAGSWIVPETQEFYLGASTQAAAESMTTAAAGFSIDVDVVEADYSYSELLRLGENLRQEILVLPTSLDIDALTSIEPITNSLTLWVFSAGDLPNSTDGLPTDIITASGLLQRYPVSKVQYESLDELPQDVDCADGPFCDPPLTAGVQVGQHDAEDTFLGHCTSGYLVKGNNNTRDYMLTAGHCVLNNSGPDVVKTRFASGSIHVIGNEATAYDNGTLDAGLIHITNPSGWAVDQGSLAASYSDEGEVGRAWIEGWGSSPMNSVRCVTTASSDMTACGRVWRLGYGSEDLGTVDVCGVIPGDSGSPVYNGNDAYGIIVTVGGGGPSLNCKANFQGMSRILRELNVSLNEHD